MSKRLFQVLDEMNVMDDEGKTAFVQVCGQQNVIAVDKKGNHGEVKIGVPPNIPIEVLQGKDLRFMLLIVDGKKYDELSK